VQRVLLAIHGVGNPLPGSVATDVRKNLEGRSVQIEVGEYNWNKPGLYPVDGGALAFWSVEAVAGAFDTSAGLGFEQARAGYAGFGPLWVIMHNAVANAAKLCAAMSFTVLIALPPLLIPTFVPLFWIEGFRFERFVPATAAFGILIKVGAYAALLLVAIGALHALLRRRLGMFVVSLRRAGLLALQPIALVLLPPFAVPWSSFTGLAFTLIKLVHLVLFSTYIVLYLVGRPPGWMPVAGVSVLAIFGMAAVTALAVSTRTVIAPLLKIALDIFRYVGDPAYRRAIQDGLDAKIGEFRAGGAAPDEYVLLTHSLGSVIAVDSLLNSQKWGGGDRVLLITMGSPIARYFCTMFEGLFFPRSPAAIGDAAAARLGFFSWVNVYRPLDPIGASLGLPDEKKRERNTRQYRIGLAAHVDYWSDPVVGDALMEVIPKLPRWPPQQGPPPPDANYQVPKPTHVPHRLEHASSVYFAFAALLALGFCVIFSLLYAEEQRWWQFQRESAVLDIKGRHVRSMVDVTYKAELHFEQVQVTETDPIDHTTRTRMETRQYDSDHFIVTDRARGGLVVGDWDERYGGEFDDDVRLFSPVRIKKAAMDIPPDRPGTFWNPEKYQPRTLRGVEVFYSREPGPTGSPLRMYFPAYPPPISPHLGFSGWLGIAFMSLFYLVVIALMLCVNYICFLYFYFSKLYNPSSF
jgi:hypothetical protein